MDHQVLEKIRLLYKSWAGQEPDQLAPLPQAGSARQYFRLLSKEESVIATYNSDIQENEAFISFTNHFTNKGLAVPAILKVSPDQSCYLQYDLGDSALYLDLPYSVSIKEKYQKTLVALAQIQVLGDEGFPYEKAYPSARFDRDSMRWDLDYFKYFFLKLQEVSFDEAALEIEFNAILDWLMKAPAWHFMHRDCQSRNVIFKSEQPYFIDYQGGRKGPVAYDVASLLWQAKAQIPATEREELLNFYIQELKNHTTFDEASFRSTYYGFVLHRSLQVLGAYGFRGLIQRKPHFIQSIPFALANIQWLFKEIDFPVPLKEIQNALAQTYSIHRMSSLESSEKLIVRITSFSYKRGIPEDPSGNGGGYVFDCRPLLNPGRFEGYMSQTGLDPEVQTFLLERSKIEDFWAPVFLLVDRAVDNYVERGFKHLQVNFGCTGGQHRSVFSAESLAKHLEEKEGVEVILNHRERSYWP